MRPLACIHTHTNTHTHTHTHTYRKFFQLRDPWRTFYPRPLCLFVKMLQLKVGLAGYDILFAYFVVEVKSVCYLIVFYGQVYAVLSSFRIFYAEMYVHSCSKFMLIYVQNLCFFAFFVMIGHETSRKHFFKIKVQKAPNISIWFFVIHHFILFSALQYYSNWTNKIILKSKLNVISQILWLKEKSLFKMV